MRAIPESCCESIGLLREYGFVTKSSGYATAASAAMVPMLAALVLTTLVLAALAGASAWGESPAADDGLRVFKSANCVGCHKW
ncbi:MAG TPA: hypothetical protein VE690_21855, partial [Rhodopila sp.]|nr:hypothetical protein [Rhodopila sp.]